MCMCINHNFEICSVTTEAYSVCLYACLCLYNCRLIVLYTYEYFILLSFTDTKNWMATLPSFEFINFVFALIVWSSRYPSVYWNTSKAFSLIFSIQMIANAIDLLLVFAGVSVIYKLQVVGQKLPLSSVSFPM